MSSDASLPRFWNVGRENPSISQFAGTGISFQSWSFRSAAAKLSAAELVDAGNGHYGGALAVFEFEPPGAGHGKHRGIAGAQLVKDGAFPTKGTGAAIVRNIAKTARNIAKIPARQLIGFILFFVLECPALLASVGAVR